MDDAPNREIPTSDVGERVTLGSSGVEVTRLGLGTSQLGGLYRHVPDEVAHEVVRQALGHGVGLIDTAPQYGHGVSEQRVGVALREVPRDTYTLCTKVGRLIEADESGPTGPFVDAPPSRAVPDYTRDGVLRSVESSLTRLGVDRLDVVLIHDCDDHEDDALRHAYPALHELRSSGVVGAIGLGMTQTRIPTRFIRETDIDAVLLAGRYNLLDRSAEDELLPAALERGVSVMVAGVYASGVLAAPREGARYDYDTADAPTLERARRLQATCERHGVTLPAAAMQFSLRHPAVACVVMAARNTAQLEQNITAFRTPLPPQLWEAFNS